MNGRALCVNKRSVSHINRKKQNPMINLDFLRGAQLQIRRRGKVRLTYPIKQEELHKLKVMEKRACLSGLYYKVRQEKGKESMIKGVCPPLGKLFILL